MSTEVVRFHPGQPIDTRKILEIIGLSATSSHWGEIETVYPEIEAAGPQASFRGAHNVTIFPPTYHSKRHLNHIATLGDDKRHIYKLEKGGQVAALLVHVEGGYASLHIYRLQS